MTDTSPGPAASHALGKVIVALERAGARVERRANLRAASEEFAIVAGLAPGDGPAARLVQEHALSPPVAPEGLLIHRLEDGGTPILLVAGADDRGLMYACLDLADRIEESGGSTDPLREVENTRAQPDVRDRALSIYTMHRESFERRLHDERYWERYFDLLAASRFNRFVVIFGYENGGYMAPPYPYFFDVEEFPEVHVVGLSPESQRRNLHALRRLIDQAHRHGLEFTAGIWDHIYRGGVQGGGPREASRQAGKRAPGLVWGVTTDNLVPYSVAALRTLFEALPELDSIQFRMHGESGLKRAEMAAFWERIYRVVLEVRPDIRFDARAKNFPDSLIDLALEMGVDIRICTKYWMEQMGLPFHPSHIHPQNQHDRRHGYADLLRYPRRYPVHWRLWNGGTTRVLLWGDPDYVRRFVASTHLYDGEGFEINEPLATKMEAQPHDAPPFELLAGPYREYEWEFERYWHFFQLFGRLAYDPNTPPDTWRREFERRFGKAAAPSVERGLHLASRILPRIVAYCYPYRRFPTTRGWAEKQRMEDLPEYARSLPSDTEQFRSPRDAARDHLEGRVSAKISPVQSSAWFGRIAAEILALVDEAERRVDGPGNPEFRGTMVDLRILAHLARYHSHRALAGFRYALFDLSGDFSALDDAIAHESRAVESWGDLVKAVGDVYADNLRMGFCGAGLCGHWRDELDALRRGLAELRTRRASHGRAGAARPLSLAHVPVRRLGPGEDLVLRATIAAQDDARDITARAIIRGSGWERAVTMARSVAPVFRAVVPAASPAEGIEYRLEAGDGPDDRARLPGGAPPGWIPVAVTADLEPPRVEHAPPTSARAGRPLRIAARVRDPSGVEWVRLRYRGVTQFQDYRTLELRPTGEGELWDVEVPGDQIDSQWDFMYFLEVMDTQGNGAIHPNLETETPYVIVHLVR